MGSADGSVGPTVSPDSLAARLAALRSRRFSIFS